MTAASPSNTVKSIKFLKTGKIMFIFNTIFIAFLFLGVSAGFPERTPLRDGNTGRPLPWWQILDKHSIGILPDIQYSPSSAKACLVWDETSVDGPENALWYFREDFLVNAQHIFWHMVNPNGFANPNTPLMQDRRGELFYYFHRNMLARYDAERLSNGFDRVKAIIYEERAFLEMGYDPHFHENKTMYDYLARGDNISFVDITYNTDVLRIIEADINNRTLVALNGSLISLNNEAGIDLLADLIEASTNNINKYRYSDFGVHNNGHQDIGMMSYDGGENSLAVMMNPSTAMRDPAFYMWHKLIDDLVYSHQTLLTPHHPVEGEFPLLWPGVSVDSLSVHSENQSSTLRTYFTTLNVSMPLQEDIFRTDEVTDYCLKRLNYDAFFYNITIGKQPFVRSSRATVRVFMAPRFNESGNHFALNDQTRQFFALDAFTVHLDVGQTTFARNASSSSLNLNWKLETWMESPPSGDDPECGCGWPSHLLIPKGTSEGMAFDLFLMVTDAEIDDPSSSLPKSEEKTTKQEPVCKMSTILCGIEGEKYPDTRPMGYPFNTRPFSIDTPEGGSRMVSDLEEYVSLLPNTKAIQVVIRHDG